MSKSRKEMFPKAKEKIAEVLELPKDIVLNLSKIIIYENKGAIIENFVGLTDYDGEKLTLKTEKGTIKITGKNIFIKEFGEREINISGEFLSIEFNH